MAPTVPSITTLWNPGRLTTGLFSQGYQSAELIDTLKKLCGRYHDLVYSHNVTFSRTLFGVLANKKSWHTSEILGIRFTRHYLLLSVRSMDMLTTWCSQLQTPTDTPLFGVHACGLNILMSFGNEFKTTNLYILRPQFLFWWLSDLVSITTL